MQKFCILEGLRCKNYAWPYFALNSRLILQEKNDVEIMHFSLAALKIWMQKFCLTLFPANFTELKSTMQTEILHP